MSLYPMGALTTSKQIPKNASERICRKLAGTSKISEVLILKWKIAAAHIQREPFGNKLELPEHSFSRAGEELQNLATWLMTNINISDFRACDKALWSCCNLKIKNFYHQLRNWSIVGTFPGGFCAEIAPIGSLVRFH